MPLTRADVRMIARFTRHWIHYGFLAHTTLCIVVSAVKGVLGG